MSDWWSWVDTSYLLIYLWGCFSGILIASLLCVAGRNQPDQYEEEQ